MKNRKSPHKKFWNKEYKTSEHLILSEKPSGDLQKFCRWQERNFGHELLNQTTQVLDLGCGNGRNLIYLAKEFGCHGIGYDISEEAISQAEKAAVDLPITFEVHSIAEHLPAPDESAHLVLDLMSSHFLRRQEREDLRAEILRILKPQGWLFFKSFLAEGDLNVKRLLHDHPADEPNAYIHPKLGVYEYVWTEENIYAFFGADFEIHKIEKSHKHLSHGRAFKRRTVSVYLQKK